MPRIFISYRRDDAIAMAGRIYDRLQQHFGCDSTFFDVDTIPFGVDFRQHIKDAVTNCDILLALIGTSWLGINQDGKRRIDSPGDFVRLEIEAALAKEIPVIPVLIGRTVMPTEDELPPALAD